MSVKNFEGALFESSIVVQCWVRSFVCGWIATSFLRVTNAMFFHCCFEATDHVSFAQSCCCLLGGITTELGQTGDDPTQLWTHVNNEHVHLPSEGMHLRFSPSVASPLSIDLGASVTLGLNGMGSGNSSCSASNNFETCCF